MQKNIMAILAAGVVGLVIGMFLPSTPAETTTLSVAEFEKIINDSLVDGDQKVSVDAVAVENGLAKISMDINGQTEELFATVDGTKFFPQVLDLAEIEAEKAKAPVVVDVDKDHILGNKDAKVFVIEYSDTQCPFCKRYNDESFAQLKEKYGAGEDVAFVYRPFPLASLHPTASTEAVALECAADLGGDDKFFELKAKVFELTKTNNVNADEVLNALPVFAQEIGLNKAAFETCQKDPAMIAKVDASFAEGIAGGVQGTPTVYIQAKGGVPEKTQASFGVIDKTIQTILK